MCQNTEERLRRAARRRRSPGADRSLTPSTPNAQLCPTPPAQAAKPLLCWDLLLGVCQDEEKDTQTATASSEWMEMTALKGAPQPLRRGRAPHKGRTTPHGTPSAGAGTEGTAARPRRGSGTSPGMSRWIPLRLAHGGSCQMFPPPRLATGVTEVPFINSRTQQEKKTQH